MTTPTSANNQILLQETPLNPPVSVGGTLYSRFLKVTSWPQTARSLDVVSGKVKAVSRDGDYATIVCARAPQYSDYQINYGFGNTVTVIYPCEMGGNVALTHEAERLNSYGNSAMGIVGGNADSRAIQNDVVWVASGGVDLGFKIVDAVAYAVPPVSVNYVPADVDQQVMWTRAVDIMDIYLNPGQFDVVDVLFPTADSFFSNQYVPGVYLKDENDAVVLASRLSFNSTYPDHYLLAADFGEAEMPPRYHYDSATRKFKFSSAEIAGAANSDVPFTDIVVNYWIKKSFHGSEIWSGSTGYPIVHSSEGGINDLEYDPGEDNYSAAVSQVFIQQDHSKKIRIVNLQNDGAGTPKGCVMIRETNDVSGRAVALHMEKISGTQFTLSTSVRDTQGGEWSVEDGDTVNLVMPFEVECSVSSNGDTIRFIVRQNPTDTVAAAKYDFSYSMSSGSKEPFFQSHIHLFYLGNGKICWMNGQFENTLFTWRLSNLGKDGALYAPWSNTFTTTPISSEDRDIATVVAAEFDVEADTTAVVSVTNKTTGIVMSESDSPSRATYKKEWVTTGTPHWRLTFYCEAAGDVIEVLHEGVYEAGDPGPGRCPRVFGQDNFATPKPDPNPNYEPTSDVNENIANWYDKLVIFDPQNLFPETVGTEFTVKRNPCFDPENPPILEWASPNTDPIYASNWAEVPDTEYVVLAVEGCVFVSKSWIDSVVAQGYRKICFRLIGGTYQQQGHYHEKIFSRLTSAFESLANAHTDPGLSVISGPAVSGMFVGGINYQYACSMDFPHTHIDTNVYPSSLPVGVVWGSTPSTYRSWYDDMATFGYGWPHYDERAGLRFYDASGDLRNTQWTTSFCEANYTDCYPAYESGWDTYPWMQGYSACDQGKDGAWVFILNPFGASSATNHMGAETSAWDLYLAFGLVNGTIADFQVSFSFTGIGINFPELIARLPQNAEILDAKLRVKFDGIREKSWSVVSKNVPAFPEPFGLANGVPPDPDGQSHRDVDLKYTVNGDVWADLEYRWTGGGNGTMVKEEGILFDDPPGTPTPDSTQATISFVLMGQRQNTTAIYIPRLEKYVQAKDNDYRTYGASLTAKLVNDGEWEVVDVTDIVHTLASLSVKDSEYTEFFLWPTTASVDPNDSDGNLLSYLTSLAPETSVSLVKEYDSETGILTRCGWAASWSGRYVYWNQLSVGSLEISFRLPSGVLDKIALPLAVAPLA